jgi:hypothetical protein
MSLGGPLRPSCLSPAAPVRDLSLNPSPLWDNAGAVRTGIRYVASYVLGVAVWGIVFYAVFYRWFGFDPQFLQKAFLVLAGVLAAAQGALYFNERILSYRARLRYIFAVTFFTTMTLAGLVAWWVFTRLSLPWRAVAMVLLPAFLVASGTTWLAYRLVLHFRIGERAHELARKER